MVHTVNYSKSGHVVVDYSKLKPFKTHKALGNLVKGYGQLLLITGILTTIAYIVGHM